MSWTLLYTGTNVNNWTAAAKSFNVSTSASFKIFKIVVSRVGNFNVNLSRTSVQISRLRLYGVPQDTTTLNYPPTELTANSTSITTADYGTGTYVASASSTSGSFAPFNAFNNSGLTSGTKSYWSSTSNAFNATTGSFANAAVTWIARTSAVDNGWSGVTWSPELNIFVAIANSGSGNRVMTSPDGTTWTTRVSAADNSWVRVIWSSELRLFVSVAQSGTGNRVMTNSDGITWLTRTSAADNNWWGLVWSPELRLFVATSRTGTGNRVMTSPDGITWTTRSSAADNEWMAVSWSPTLRLFAAVGFTGSGNRVMTSPDGINWTTRASAADNNWINIVWATELGLFVATSLTGTGNRVMTSADGITWTTRASAANNNWYGLTWCPELRLFVAVSDNGTGNRVMTSPDGITWTTRSSAADNSWGSIAWAPDLNTLVAVANTGTGNRVMTSGGYDIDNMISNTYVSWSDESPNSTKSSQTTDTDVYQFAFRVTRIRDGTATFYGLTQTVPVASTQIGKIVTLVLRYKRRNVTGNNRLESSLQFFNSSDVSVGTTGTVGDTRYNTNDTTWRRFSYQATIPANTAKILVRIGSIFSEDFDMLPDVKLYTGFTSEYLQLQLPRSISLDSFAITPIQDTTLCTRRSPRYFLMLGSTDGTNWTHLYSGSNTSFSANPIAYMYGSGIGGDFAVQATRYLNDGRIVYMVEGGIYTKMITLDRESRYYTGKISDFNANNWSSYTTYSNYGYRLRFYASPSSQTFATNNSKNSKYNYFRLLTTLIGNSNEEEGKDSLQIAGLSFFEKGVPQSVNSIVPNISIGGVYQTAAENAPVLVSNVLEYPPGPLTSNSTNFSNYAWGNGTYTLSASSDNGPNSIYNLFDKDNPSGNGWYSLGYYNSTTGSYIGTTGTLSVDGTNYLGEHVTISLPQPIKLSSYTIIPRQDNVNAARTRSPQTFWVLASNDNVKWTLIDTQSGLTWDTTKRTFNVNTNSMYNNYRIVCNANGGSASFVSFAEWILYANAEPNSKPYLSFNRANADYLIADTKTFNINTNGGLTSVVRARFNGSVGNNENLFDFGGVIKMFRSGTTGNLSLTLSNGTNGSTLTGSNLITQGEWTYFGCRYNSATNLTELYKNGVKIVSGTNAVTLPNITSSTNYIGRPVTGNDSYSNIDLSSLYIFDRYLSDAEFKSLQDYISNGSGAFRNTSSTKSVTGRYIKLSKSGNSNAITAPEIEVLDSNSNNVAFNKNIVHRNTLSAFTSATIGSTLSARNYNVIQNGLIAHFDPNDPTCYIGSGATMSSLVGSVTGTLGGSYSFGNGNIRLNNTSGTGSSNVSNLKCQTIFNMTTISLWYYQHSTIGSFRALFDARGGAVGGQLLSWSIGSNLSSGVVYKNGGSSQSVTWNNIETVGSWQNITVVANTPMTDDINFFSKQDMTDGLDVTFGPILVYNRALTAAENEFNYNAVLNNYFSTTVITEPSFAHLSKRSVAYPPLPLSSNATSISGESYGNGAYSVSISSTSAGAAWNAFDGSSGTIVTTGTGVYNSSTGSYSGTVSTTDILGNSFSGEYLQIKLPERIYTTGLSITPNTTTFATSAPTNFSLLGSANNIDWNPLMTNVTTGWSSSAGQTFNVGGTAGSVVAYDNYRFVANAIGTNNTDGSLSLADVQLLGGTTFGPNKHLAFPPAAMTAGTTIISGQGYGNGTYIASGSSTNSNDFPYQAFDNSITGTSYWSSSTNVYNTTTGSYTGSTSMTSGSIGYAGEWLQLQTPNNILLDSFSIVARQDLSLWIPRSPRTFYVFGSIDGSTWELISSHNTTTFAPNGKFYISNSSKAYNYFRLLTNSVGYSDVFNSNKNMVNIAEWKLYGVPTSAPAQVTNPYAQIDLGADTALSSVILYNDISSTSNRASASGGSLSILDSAGTVVYTKNISSDSSTYTLLDLNTPDTLSSTSTNFSQVFNAHNDSVIALDSTFDGTWSPSSVSVPFALRKLDNNFRVDIGSLATTGNLISWSPSISINNSGGISLGNGGSVFTGMLEGVATIGTGNAGINTATISLGQTLTNSNYRVFVEMDAPDSTILECTVTNKTTTSFDIKLYNPNQGNSWASSVNVNWTVII